MILYAARVAPWARGLLTVVSVLMAAPFAALALMSLLHEDGPSWLGAAIFLPFAVPPLWLLLAAYRSAFLVTTEGVVDRWSIGGRRASWEDVERIEVEQQFHGRGRTVVVTRSGRRWSSLITSPRHSLLRGESTFDHGPDLRTPAIPTRAAIDAHVRYLRGEFGRQSAAAAVG